MDVNTWRSAVTLLSLVIFLGIVVWAYARRHTKAFEQAAQLPFEQD